MSVFASDLLEEIVETTEEQEADLCSSGETVDECTGLPLGSEFIEEPEHKHQPHLVSSPTTPPPTTSNATSSSSGSGSRPQKSSSSRSSSSSQNLALNGNANPGRGASSRNHMEQEKRMRREIANSNERRRMQSINAGFQSLRTLLPHHEGEKLSKAAILQQTAEYIYQLEQQKTQLLSQNLQLKRLVDQHEGGDVPTKKRKHESQGVVVSLPVHVSESGDEGLGSMSPEPLSVITVSADGHASVGGGGNNNNNGDSQVAELKRQLERERNARAHLEKQMRTLQSQLFPNDRYREEQIIAYQPHEVIEHTNNVLQQDLDDAMPGLQVVSVVSVPTVGSTQTVETSNADSNTPPLSPQPASCEIIVPNSLGADDVAVLPPKDPRLEVTVNDILQQVESRPTTPSPQSQPQSQVTKIVAFAGVAGTVFASTIDEQTVVQNAGSFSPAYAATLTPTTVTGKFEATPTGQFITASPTRPFSPEEDGSQQRLPSVLEAAMKAEPKVEVERLPSPSNSLDDVTSAPQARLYVNTSRQNLETIVEAIRHLEGDHLFSDEQDVPLALTNKSSNVPTTNHTTTSNSSSSPNTKRLHAEVNSFLQFNNNTSNNVQQSPPTQQSSAQQVRPGVIVVKHS